MRHTLCNLKGGGGGGAGHAMVVSLTVTRH